MFKQPCPSLIAVTEKQNIATLDLIDSIETIMMFTILC